jgi:hypothetical protein
MCIRPSHSAIDTKRVVHTFVQQVASRRFPASAFGDRLSRVKQIIRRLLLVLVVAVPALLGVGCSREVIDVENPYVLARSEYDAVFAATKQALHEQGFKLDRVDYRFGTITSKPLTSPTIMEPWHDMNTTFSQAVESTINNQRRYVIVTLEGYYKQARTGTTVTIKPDPGKPDKPVTPAPVATATTSPTPESVAPLAATTQPAEHAEVFDGYRLRIAVFVERLEVPDRRLGGSSSGKRQFDQLNSAPTELRERGITGPYWLPIGRDPYLENRLIASVVRLSVTK